MPVASVARTSKVCEVLVRLVYALGEVHEPQEPASIRHSYVEPDSEEVNPKLPSATVTVPDGPEEIDVSGGVVSGGGGTLTVQVREAGLPSVLPAASLARTSKVCEALVRLVYALGLLQDPQFPVSIRHS